MATALLFVVCTSTRERVFGNGPIFGVFYPSHKSDFYDEILFTPGNLRALPSPPVAIYAAIDYSLSTILDTILLPIDGLFYPFLQHKASKRNVELRNVTIKCMRDSLLKVDSIRGMTRVYDANESLTQGGFAMNCGAIESNKYNFRIENYVYRLMAPYVKEIAISLYDSKDIDFAAGRTDSKQMKVFQESAKKVFSPHEGITYEVSITYSVFYKKDYTVRDVSTTISYYYENHSNHH